MKIAIEVKENYKNMKEVLKNYPELTDNAIEAARRAGVKAYIDRFAAGPMDRD